MECLYCKNTFSNISVLNNHIRTAKYCLKIQNKNNKSNNKSNNKCKGCGKQFTTTFNLERHTQTCNQIEYVQKYIEDIKNLTNDNNKLTDKLYEKSIMIEDQRQIIKDLQDKLENIAIKAVQRPTTMNMSKTNVNNFIQNMEPLTRDHMLEQSNNLTLEHIQKGASGYAEYALEYPLKERVACVDYSRRKLKFKDKDGNTITDPEMVKLAPMFFDSIKEKSSEIVYDLNKEDMDSAMFEEVAKLFNTNSDVKNSASGVKSDFYHDFVKQVCSGSVVE